MFLMQVAVQVVVVEGSKMTVQTQSHQKPSILIGQVLRGAVEHNPCRIKLQ